MVEISKVCRCRSSHLHCAFHCSSWNGHILVVLFLPFREKSDAAFWRFERCSIWNHLVCDAFANAEKISADDFCGTEKGVSSWNGQCSLHSSDVHEGSANIGIFRNISKFKIFFFIFFRFWKMPTRTLRCSRNSTLRDEMSYHPTYLFDRWSAFRILSLRLNIKKQTQPLIWFDFKFYFNS